jgi:hypothetical protein
LQQRLRKPLRQIAAIASAVFEAIEEHDFADCPMICGHWTDVDIEFGWLNVQKIARSFA